MTRMSTIYSRLSYGSGTGLIGLGASARAYAQATKESVWLLADKMAGLTLGDWAIIVGMACTIGTFAINWYYRRKEYQLRERGGA
ncbi:phage holin family protein [Candidatus Symbiopectobacterium sp. NZEC127]|uniref:phage holin family protein n=1 Tax=Candidatus Symbiopectobacterium sp. NZEC127 TaxID=2820472 RepID=UPI002225C56D|nr:phage holin family protein [Candidatus Symbiopectobacterium sp. NZEC127]MCW2485951.1 phage holin family protein [Candidatus Symbiopectobacterium sp. NZEC127]